MNAIESADSSGLVFNQVLFGLAILAFIFLLIMEKKRPHLEFPQKVYKESLVTNTSAFLINNLILTVLRASSLFLVAQQFSSYGLLSGLDNGPVKWLLAFVFFDLAIYIWHVASHKNEFLWRFHKVHHSDKSFNVSTGFRFHVFDLFLEIIYKSVFVIVIGVNAYLVLSIEIVELFFIFFHHANLRIPNEEAISKFIITPSLHRTHHSTLRKEHDSNYGIVLSLWDRIFGTRQELVPEHIGLDLIEAENFIQLFSLAFITERKIRQLFGWIPKGKR
ncbi:MAG: sterol desaturase family protein [Methylobacter sp.]|nr:sterol desaturase family protein [Methylobacter sp.]MDP2428480.1 sterol desaturase family protein [Methylobacter sp.]MDP3055171.1 sterol desaturase family protein [Methylobacter sp.]MDP3363671.1 sterol desaturase family protein [Methylobacter sp.]MDZ4219778.1 sterol desaturase family protein [Methylobacter sp.]